MHCECAFFSILTYPEHAYFVLMNASFKSLCIALFTVALSTVSTNGYAQTEDTQVQETVLATLEGPVTREALNETRIALDAQGVQFHYGNFQFHPESTTIVGFELHMVIDGQEYRDYVDVPTATCTVKVIKESGFRVEGC